MTMRQCCEGRSRLAQNKSSPPTEMFYGANSTSLRDPFGHVWVLLTWKEDLNPAEMERRGNAFLRQQSSG